ncbi:MAG: discoidin domain-containing protein [Muribaculaceae bacterium]|nr:discoidin domain-containing protein [Muribaculaceae bacterium]
MKRMMVLPLMAACMLCAFAQTPVRFGEGSIASFPPTYKAKSAHNMSGFNATSMLTREIYVDEYKSTNIEGLQAPGRPIPTNDWWTDLINSRFSGALWSYPAMLSTSENGVKIHWPSYWADAGKEIKSKTNITVGGKKFRAEAAIAKEWGDWNVTFRMPSTSGDGEITVTMMHGSPFTWFEFEGVDPEINCSVPPTLSGNSSGHALLKVGDDLYGLYFPEKCSPEISEGKIVFNKNPEWLSVGLLRSEKDHNDFAPYATSIPRHTRVGWRYDEPSAKIETEWRVYAENLRDEEGPAPVVQGFLPHVYKYSLPGVQLAWADSDGFTTPRGKMKLAISPSGFFSYAYQFSGMLPINGAPTKEGSETFSLDILNELTSKYQSEGTFGGDTYWGGKGLTQMAMNMHFAKLSGNKEVYEASKRKLREIFENWLTYSPGESTFFFSYYPRWGAMLGFDVSYDSDAFNDHHFHYGYFTYAAALLCLEDRDFAEKYGEILTLIAKDYANWDRDDKRFPFMRTLDPWNGHSWAGGLGDAGNDNGNGQESTSEAMQGWGGIYLLGVALGNKEMRDAGIWGWNTEARATREYWFDVDAPRPANVGGRKAWPGKNDRQANYNYDEYPYAYNSNITGKGIGWWTWFGGDPLYMHGIQWMPISPALDYLSWDPDFAQWALDDMMSGANSSFSHDWFNYTTNSDDGNSINPLAHSDWGNVALAYMQRFDPKGAAEIFDRAYREKLPIAVNVSTGHISYYTIHSHLTYGDPDFSIHADIPTAQACCKDGVYTYFVYNPGEEDRVVNFYNSAGAKVKSVIAPAGRLAAISADPVAYGFEFEIEGGYIVPPGESALLSARVVDQYGAGMPGNKVSFSLASNAPASLSGNTLKINSNAKKGDQFILTLSSGSLIEEYAITVNDRPVAEEAIITGVPPYCEKSLSLTPAFIVTDQYGAVSTPSDTEWSLKDPEGGMWSVDVPINFTKCGNYILTAFSPSLKAKAEEKIYVTPDLPVVSKKAVVMASSAENVGTMPEGLTDGDHSTRWGSAHTDDEWVAIDLGEDCFISKVKIDWEAAYASLYDIEVAPDGCPMTTMTADYAGEKRQIKVPDESAWVQACRVENSASGEVISEVFANGRYVRMKGLKRHTVYGYSIYEMEVTGVKLSSSPEEIIGVEFNLPEVMDSGETITLTPLAFTFGGSTISNTAVEWSADCEARFTGNEFTPTSFGPYNVYGKIPGGMTIQAPVYVNEVENAAYVDFGRESYDAIAGYKVNIPFTVYNQFLAPYSGGIKDIEINVVDEEGNRVDYATYNRATCNFLSQKSGIYFVRFETLGVCMVNVRPVSEINLALGKPVTVSSTEGWNVAANAVDGDPGSRWESEWADNQWLSIDLEGLYMVDRVLISWEGAYAKSFTIEVSTDDVNYREVYSQSASQGNVESFGFAPAEARYIRLNCEKRALDAYGFSLYEIEVFGQSRLDAEAEDPAWDPEQDEEELPEYFEPYPEDEYPSFVGDGSGGNQDGNDPEDSEDGVDTILMDSSPGRADGWYTLQGLKIKEPTTSGLYIRISGGKAVKMMIGK